MKISILLETNSSGGGSFTHSVNTCLDLKRFCGTKNEIIVYTQFKQSFEILDYVKYLKPKKTYLTHLTPWMDYEKLLSKCPKNIKKIVI